MNDPKCPLSFHRIHALEELMQITLKLNLYKWVTRTLICVKCEVELQNEASSEDNIDLVHESLTGLKMLYRHITGGTRTWHPDHGSLT